MIADGIITNAKIDQLSADKIKAGTIEVDRLPGLTKIAQNVTTSNVSLVASGTQYLFTTVLSGIRAGTKVIGILTFNAVSTTQSGPEQRGCTIEIIPEESAITGFTTSPDHTFRKNSHVAIPIGSFTPMQFYIGTGVASGTSVQVRFRIGTTFSQETATMYAGATLTLLGYEV